MQTRIRKTEDDLYTLEAQLTVLDWEELGIWGTSAEACAAKVGMRIGLLKGVTSANRRHAQDQADAINEAKR
jgi:hypothetical protein